MADCIFCKIINRQAPSEILYQDALVTAFRDTLPAAPVHILIVPNRHIASMNEVTPGDETLMGHLLSVAPGIARQAGVDGSGYRLVINTGPDSGQAVFHIHLHLIGGRKLPARASLEQG